MKRIVTGLLCVSIVSLGMFFSACTPPVRGTGVREESELDKASDVSQGWSGNGHQEYAYLLPI